MKIKLMKVILTKVVNMDVQIFTAVMGTLKSLCSSWFALISRDKYEHTHLRVPIFQAIEATQKRPVQWVKD